MSWWLPQRRAALSQGDLVSVVPFGHVQHELRLLHLGQQGRGGKPTWTPTQPDRLEPIGTPVHMLAHGPLLPALVLTHSCELDKQGARSAKQRILVAPVLALATLREEDAERIRTQQRISAAYLPKASDIGDCYVDFRLMTLVQREFARDQVIASLTDEAVDLLQVRLAIYLTRREIQLGTADIGANGEPGVV